MRLDLMGVLKKYEEWLLGYTNPSGEVEGNFSEFPNKTAGLKVQYRLEAGVGMVIANEKHRTRRVDKGKSGQAQKTAVSGGFGGGILSQLLKTSVCSFWGNGVSA